MDDSRIHRAFDLLRDGESDEAKLLLHDATSGPSDSEDSRSVPIAHFLLGFAASQTYWRAGSPGAERTVSPAVHDQVIRHLTAFLDDPNRDRCLITDGEGTRLTFDEPNVFNGSLNVESGIVAGWTEVFSRWAVFPDFGRQTAPFRDDISLALDRRALAFHLSGHPLDAARDLQMALKRSLWADRAKELHGVVSEYYPNRPGDPRVSHLRGWIGWLLFDAGEYAEAADYLAACDAAMQPDDERAKQDDISPEEAKLRTWYDFLCGGYEATETHAFWEIGDWCDGLTPSQSLHRGSDGFLLRLALTLCVTNRFADALPHAECCVTISPSWYEAVTLRDVLKDEPHLVIDVATNILDGFRSDKEHGRG